MDSTLKSFGVFFFLLLISLVLAGCSPSTPTPELTPVEILQTQAAETVIAGVTSEAQFTPSPSATIEATSTFTPTLEPSASPTATATATIFLTPTPIFNIIFQDNFSSQSGWAEETNDDFGFGYLENGYTIYVNLLNAAIWSIRGPEVLSDVRVQTEASRYEGPIDGYYGVVCRHLDGENYYAMLISDNGSYGIARMLNGEFEFIVESNDEFNVIKPGETNQITGECVGERISLFVNGEEMLSLRDGTLQSGSAGIIAKTRLSPGFQALYDIFVIATP